MTTYSHSRISSFKQCPKKYQLVYVERAPKTAKSIEAFMGSRVHEALEWLYTEVSMCRVPAEDEVVERFHTVWDKEWDPCVRVVRKDRTADDYRALGERCVRGYYARYQPFDADTTIGLEQRIVMQLDEEHACQGYIDRLVKVDDGVWEIHDYKTAKRLMTQEQADADDQLATYELAIREMYPDAQDVTLVWHYLQHDTAVRSQRTPEQLDELRARLGDSIAEIETATEFPTNVSALCDWCDVRASCPEWAHECFVEEAEPDELAADEDVALVERYVELSEAVSGLGAERDNIRAELLKRLREREIDALAGTEHRVRVTRSSRTSIPSSRSAARQELEALLKEEGIWSRCSTLSAKALGDVLEEGQLPDSVRGAIVEYVTIEESETLRCSRREG